jgi:hypothetical protein
MALNLKAPRVLSLALGVAAGAVCVVGASLPAKALVIYDTNNGSANGTISIYGDALSAPSTFAPPGPQGVGMSFIPNATVNLTQVDVLLTKAEQFYDFGTDSFVNLIDPGSQVTFNIYQSRSIANSNGIFDIDIDFGALATFNLNATGTAFSPVLETASILNGPTLTQGTQYWLFGSASGNNGVDWWGTSGNAGAFTLVAPPFTNSNAGNSAGPDDNQKAFTISGTPVTGTAVPVPPQFLATALGAGIGALKLRRQKATAEA